MLFEMVLKFIYESVFLNILILVLVVTFLVYVYRKSLESRKYYKCPKCGESFRTEHMVSKCCKVCGAEVVENSDTSVNDKA